MLTAICGHSWWSCTISSVKCAHFGIGDSGVILVNRKPITWRICGSICTGGGLVHAPDDCETKARARLRLALMRERMQATARRAAYFGRCLFLNVEQAVLSQTCACSSMSKSVPCCKAICSASGKADEAACAQRRRYLGDCAAHFKSTLPGAASLQLQDQHAKRQIQKFMFATQPQFGALHLMCLLAST